jgi:hypothetical protein
MSRPSLIAPRKTGPDGCRRAQRRVWPCAGVLILSACLGACSTNIGEAIPANVGGLPVAAPERPADPPAYPAVHDMPPARPIPMLNDDQQEKLEKDLISAREHQTGRSNKRRPAVSSQPAGASQNP